MKHQHDLRLNRRQWLLATTAALTGCGGGSGTVTGSLPGTGGTGIGVQGTISGFGSVIVNSTKFDDTAASVYLDGVKLASADLRVGMVASIEGTVDSAGTSGSASRIDVWSIAKGLLRLADISGSNFLMVGMTFTTDVATSFEGLANLAAIKSDTPVAVWGVQTSGDARAWRATRVKVLTAIPTTVVSTGLFASPARTLNDMRLSDPNGSALSGFADMQLLRVEGVFDSAANTLAVSKATALVAAQGTASSGLVELEGAVTAYTSATRFSVGAISIDASKALVVGASQTVSANSSVEVIGSMQNGVLIASKVEIKGGDAAVQIDITGLVESFAGVGAFEVRGQRCDASKASVLSGLLSNLHARTKVRVIGTSEGHETLSVKSIYIDVP
jgi:hypothetical protein